MKPSYHGTVGLTVRHSWQNKGDAVRTRSPMPQTLALTADILAQLDLTPAQQILDPLLAMGNILDA